MTEIQAGILDQMNEAVCSALRDKRLTGTNKAILEGQRLFILYLRQGAEDHEKVKEMWSSFQLQKKLQIAIIIALLTELAIRLLG